MRRVVLPSLAFLSLGLIFAACGSGKDSKFVPDGPDAQPDGGGGDDGGEFKTGDGGDASACLTCAPDLRTVVTCGDMKPVMQCMGDTGCAGGTCIPACAAAAQAKSTIGCDYYALPPDAWTLGSCFAAFVTNTWDSPMTVTLHWKGQTIDGTQYAYVPTGMGASITYTKVPSTGIPTVFPRSRLTPEDVRNGRGFG